MPNLLLTDCLQHDFVGPIGRFQSLPNALHVGHEESRRLLGPDPAQGPVAQLAAWAHARPDSELRVIHIRDWHDATVPAQREHLARFGSHCLAGSAGAEFVFRSDDIAAGKQVDLVDATVLSNFVDTRLPELLARHRGQALRVGLAGVWTEAKISFLAYDLRTHFPEFEIAVCSALTASSSRANHFLALTQLTRILGVRVIDSLGEFIEYLGGARADLPLIGFNATQPQLEARDATSLDPADAQLLRYLFRGSRLVRYRALDGGFSGNRVLDTESVDLHGHEEVPHVVKIGPQGPMGQERAAFERIESVLGTSAPRIADFADFADRGGIKYRYAAMGRGGSRSLQKLYQRGEDEAEIARVLQQVFGEQLGRLYAAASPERTDLLDYYDFQPKWAAGVRRRVAALTGGDGSGEELRFAGGRVLPHVGLFYERELTRLPRLARAHYFAWVHGDLNGANILVDAPGNVWMIDFFHAHRGHVLRDLVKLENDLLYIWTPLDEAELPQALDFTDRLLQEADLGRPPAPEDASQFALPQLQRAWRTLCKLRSFYPPLIQADRDAQQLLIAQIRYAVHTLGFDECTDVQKRWALYTAAAAIERYSELCERNGPLRVDWLAATDAVPARVGLTLLPGRRDLGRELDSDLASLREQGVDAVLCLLASDEFVHYGVESLMAAYARAGFASLHQPIVDGRVPAHAELQRALDFIDTQRAQGSDVLIHCVGGLGRAGTIAAAWLVRHGRSPAQAIAEIRATRSPRAIETALQEAFLAELA
ncbi:MAG: isochorismatase family protein [Xanthomonadales bacterium]|nr:isochorismatase family protein [Xanthomonadales bacterium]